MKYVNTKTGEEALLVNRTNAGTDETPILKYTLLGERGRFFAEGMETKEWVPFASVAANNATN